MLIDHNEIFQLLQSLKPVLRQKIDEIQGDIKIKNKADSSPVTELDIFISKTLKKIFTEKYPFLNFYSEEEMEKFEYPVIIVDPIDGTKEFIKGSDEWVVSFGVYYSSNILDERNFSWIYNPTNLLEICSNGYANGGHLSKNLDDKILVSITEYDSGLYRNSNQNLLPVGSIAYKLALLSLGKCKAVVTKRDKNVWDILAGTHLCLLRNMIFYSTHEQNLTQIKNLFYKKDMIWCKENHLDSILKNYLS